VLLSALRTVPGLTVFGLTDPYRLEERVANLFICLKNIPPRKVAEKLGGTNYLCVGM